MKWQPKDVIACIIIVACFVLLILGKDSVVTWTLLGVVGAYYGIDLTPWFKIGRRHPPKEEG
uniref:Uncharacterized protein n=1 Tax=viral metagenome TaxID=1070528 RepID=A0A6M3XVV5_9ZZZZ